MEGKKNSQNVFFPPPSKLLCRCSQCKNNADLFFYYYYFFGEVCVVTCCLTFDCNRSQCYLVTIHHLSILQLENLFFFIFALNVLCFFSLSFCVCVWKVWEREISIKSFLRWTNGVVPIEMNVLVGSFPSSLWTCINDLLVYVKKGRRIGVVAYWILWARPKYFGGSFFFFLTLNFFLTAVHCSPSPVFSPLSIDP